MDWDKGTILKVDRILSQRGGKDCEVRRTLNNLAEGKVIYPTTGLSPWDLQIPPRGRSAVHLCKGSVPWKY